MPLDTTSEHFFEEMYSRNRDPWNFASSSYELNRYDAIINALANCRYCHVFEPGCSIGVLTERLASLCDQVDARDLSPTAVAIAQERCSRLPNVKIECASLEQTSVPAGVDLLLLSEIGYYFERERWRILAKRLVDGIARGGTILAAHWLGHSADHREHGDAVHEILHMVESMTHEYAERNSNFRIDRWRKS